MCVCEKILLRFQFSCVIHLSVSSFKLLRCHLELESAFNPLLVAGCFPKAVPDFHLDEARCSPKSCYQPCPDGGVRDEAWFVPGNTKHATNQALEGSDSRWVPSRITGDMQSISAPRIQVMRFSQWNGPRELRYPANPLVDCERWCPNEPAADCQRFAHSLPVEDWCEMWGGFGFSCKIKWVIVHHALHTVSATSLCGSFTYICVCVCVCVHVCMENSLDVGSRQESEPIQKF